MKKKKLVWGYGGLLPIYKMWHDYACRVLRKWILCTTDGWTTDARTMLLALLTQSSTAEDKTIIETISPRERNKIN